MSVNVGLRDIDVSAADEIYGIDATSDQVVVYNNTFQVARQFGVPCDVQQDDFIAVGTSRVFVTTNGCAVTRVRAYALDGSQGTAFVATGTGVGQAQVIKDLVADASENLYALDTVLNKVLVYNNANVFVREFAVCPGEFPRSFALSIERQQLYIDCTFSIKSTSTTGTPISTAGLNAGQHRMEATSESLLLAAGTNELVSVLSLDAGEFVEAGPRMLNTTSVASRNPDVIYGVKIVGPTLFRAVRTYRSGIPPSTRIPLPNVLTAQPRPGTTVFDVDYRVRDADSATVTTAVVAYVSSGGDVLYPRSFVEGTAANVGAGIATNAIRRVSWDAAADYPSMTGFVDIRFGVIANDGRPLIEFQFLDLDKAALREPSGVPDCGTGTLRIARSPITLPELQLPFLWLIARNDPAISFQNNQVTGVSPPFTGQVLGTNTGPNSVGIDFMLDRLGYRIATATELACAREGTTPGVQGYPPTAVTLAKNAVSVVNEVGLDTTVGAGFIRVVDP